MFIHIGKNYFVNIRDIIVVLNNKSIVNFKEAVGEKSCIVIKHKKNKMYSTVICDDATYITPIRSATLFYRLRNCKKIFTELTN